MVTLVFLGCGRYGSPQDERGGEAGGDPTLHGDTLLVLCPDLWRWLGQGFPYQSLANPVPQAPVQAGHGSE